MRRFHLPACFAAALLACRAGFADSGCEFGFDPDTQIKDCSDEIEHAKPGDPRLVDYYTGRAEAWAEKGDFDQALRDSERALEFEPHNSSARVARCLARIDVKQYAQAVADCSGVIARPRDDYSAPKSAAYTRRAVAWALMGKLEESIADSTLAIENGSTRAYYNRGLVWLRKGEHAKALADYEAALAANPADPGHWRERPQGWAALGSAERATALYAGIELSGIMTTSPQVARVWAAHETRFGTVLEVATRMHPDPNSTLLLNGKAIFESLGNYLSFKERFTLGDTDALLFGVGPRVSDRLFFVLLSDETPVVIAHPGLKSDDGTLKNRVEQKTVVLDLGFSGGVRQYAELADGKLTFRSEQTRIGVLPEDCAGLFRMAAEHCPRPGSDCEQAAPDAANSESSFITYVSQQPGFSAARLRALCRDTCVSAHMTAPEIFIRDVCGYAAPDAEAARAIESAMQEVSANAARH